MIIEVMSIGEDLYGPMLSSIELLNSVQVVFRFRAVPSASRADGLAFERNEYRTQEIWDFLGDYRLKTGGQHPYLLGFLNRPLASDKLKNLFGSHNAESGMAVATLHGHVQFVSDPKRYMAYYMVRYALSFINPKIRSHNDPTRKDCYFHRKLYKPDIRDSMSSGTICDLCLAELDSCTSSEQRTAIKAMRDIVSGQYPYALIMKGGGIKGLAFAGALLELERYFSFDLFAGASAGAITAALLGAGYTPTELLQTLAETSFANFLDASRLRSVWNLLTTYGLYSGDAFEQWIKDLLSKKFKKVGKVEMQHLHECVFYACTPAHGTVVFDSRSTNRNMDAAFAARCSMSIPLFFRPMTIEQRRVYDGGMRNNFPVARFLADNPGRPFVALYLGEQLQFRKPQSIFADLFDIWLGGDELAIVDGYSDNVVVINPKPISTLDFALTESETDFLVKAGQAAAMRLVLRRQMDDAPSAEQVEAAEREVERLRELVTKERSTRRRRARLRLGLITVSIALLVLLLRWIYHWLVRPHHH